MRLDLITCLICLIPLIPFCGWLWYMSKKETHVYYEFPMTEENDSRMFDG